ncbi:MAG TPA: hypothetical protein PKN18_04530 [Pseudomonadales bacterium]|nr:hypothetical protein [Pseudomonadales bacterium]
MPDPAHSRAQTPARFTPPRHSTLGDLYQQAETLAALQRLLAPLFEQFGIDCDVAGYREGRLLLICADAARALRARHSGARLLLELRRLDRFRALQRIEWRVRPVQQPARALPLPQRPKPASARLLSDRAYAYRNDTDEVVTFVRVVALAPPSDRAVT